MSYRKGNKKRTKKDGEREALVKWYSNDFNLWIPITELQKL